MKLEIPTRGITSSLPLRSVELYLESRGWSQQGFWGPNAAIHALEQDGRHYEVLVPLRDTLSDYAEVMERLISMLAEVEGRSEFDVFVDLTNTGSDVIRLASANGFSGDAMSLSMTTELYQGARNLLANAARSVQKPKASYTGRFSREVVEYLETIVPAVNSQSRYSLTLQSPVPSYPGYPNGSKSDNGESFARKTVNTLASSLHHASRFIDLMDSDGSISIDYDEAISAGLSSNLCENVASLVRIGHGIDIGISWAQSQPNAPPNQQFLFAQRTAVALTAVSRDLRRRDRLDHEWAIVDESRVEVERSRAFRVPTAR